MATGKTSIPIEPARRKTGAVVQRLGESASQTYPAGCLVIKSAGVVSMHATSFVSVSLFGVALKSGRNGSANGVKSNQFYRFQAGEPFKVVMTGTLASSNLGQTIALSQNTAGVVVGVSAATASDSSVARAIEFAEGFSESDTNPVVLFVPLTAKIQEG